MRLLEDNNILTLFNNLKNQIRKNTFSDKSSKTFSAPRFVFICGKAFEEGVESIREYIMNYFDKILVSSQYGIQNKSVLSVISEYLYTEDICDDIFSFEVMLAEISDKIIIVTESFGTCCELGAFVMNEQCRRKILVFNEDKEDYKNSFISKGPIKLLESRNSKSVFLHNGLARIKKSSEYSERLKEVSNASLKIIPNNDSNNLVLKSLIYELYNLIELFYPLEAFEIEKIYKIMKGFEYYQIENSINHKIRTIINVLSLMEKMTLITKKDGYYVPQKNISCFNVMFSISRRDFNSIRVQYLNRLYKYHSERL